MYRFKRDFASAYSPDNNNVAQRESKESLLTMPSPSDVMEDKETASKRLAHEIYSNKPLMPALQTTNNGTEFADHKYIAKCSIPRFISHTHSPTGRKAWSKTQTSSSVSTSQRSPISLLSAVYILYVQTDIDVRP